MNRDIANSIAIWWVRFTDKQYLKQDLGDRETNKIATINRIQAPSLTEYERDVFVDELTLAICNHDETKDLEIYIDYEPNDFLYEVLTKCKGSGSKIQELLPMKTFLNYDSSTRKTWVKNGYSDTWKELND